VGRAEIGGIRDNLNEIMERMKIYREIK